MQTFAALLMLLVPAAQDDLTVLKADEATPRLLYRHLQAECGKHFDARRKAVAALKTPEDVRRRQEMLKAKFVDAIGGFPEKTPLNARVVERQQRKGYVVEKVIFESRPNHHVTALLYLPKGKPPFPGVLVPCGHSINGKARDLYQRAPILMALNGMAALCYDPIGQGERIQLFNDDGKPAFRGSTTEHSMVGVGALLVGWDTASYRIWDGIRCLDYLASRPEVDGKRLGCTGISGGGTMTSYLMVLDDRIVAAAPGCYITSLERLFETIGPQDAEQNILGQVAFGMEHADYITMRAPRPTLIKTTTSDFFDIDGAWTTFREAKRVYGLIGYGERVDFFEMAGKHGWPRPMREAGMRWMRRWLLDMDDARTEEDFRVYPDAEVLCTKSGKVVPELKGKSVFDLQAARARALAARRGGKKKADLLKAVRRLIALRDPAPASVSVKGRLEREGYRIQRILFEPEPGISVPALHFLPGGEPKGRPILYVHGRGKAADAGGAIERLVEKGRQVLAVDLRGMGETSPGKAGSYRRWGPAWLGDDWSEAYLSFHLDRPLLGQRVADLLSVIRGSGLGPKVDLVGVGIGGPIVLHAAALDERIAAVTVREGLVSWSSVVRIPRSRRRLSNVVPGALEVYDLPDLAAAIAPRPLTLLGPLDAAGNPVSAEEIRRAYSRAISAYRDAGSPDRLKLRAGK